MSQKFTTLVVSLVLAVVSCVNSQNPASQKSESRDLTGFNSVILNIPADVTLKQGDFHFSISASEALLGKIKTEVRSGDLIITFNDQFQTNQGEHIVIDITIPSLKDLEVNGSGSIKSSALFNEDEVSLEINGSGMIGLSSIAAQEVRSEINGSGNITYSGGSARVAHFEINGSGNIDAANFQSKVVEAAVTGSGKIKLNATEELNADVTGSGNIYYKGNPVKKNVDVTGSGKIGSL